VTVAAVVPAAGRGERLGPGAPKALRRIGGQPLLVHAVRALGAAPSVEVVVVAAPAADVQAVSDLLADLSFDARIRVVAGGPSRQASVGLALAVLDDHPDVDVVLVHDAARPLVPVALIESVVAAVRSGASAVVPGMPVADTIKRIETVDATALVAETLDRAGLRAIQTPQGFDRAVLVAAHAAAAELGAAAAAAPATDDAALVERFGHRIHVVHGDEEAFKVTRPIDLVLAEALLARRRAAEQ
jgi:2-C-methyl-D-erythritol 4-phosphate cytidylyltransferase